MKRKSGEFLITEKQTEKVRNLFESLTKRGGRKRKKSALFVTSLPFSLSLGSTKNKKSLCVRLFRERVQWKVGTRECR